MHIVRHLRALADRAAYSRVVHTKRVYDYEEVELVDEVTGEVRMVWARSSGSGRTVERKRKVKRRVKRWRSMHGFEVVNDGLARLPDIARIMHHYLHEISDLEGFDVQLLDKPQRDWFDT